MQNAVKFQSPRSGKFESNAIIKKSSQPAQERGFNPLDRGNLNQIDNGIVYPKDGVECFNPLDRGNLNQMPREFYKYSRRTEVSIP